MHIKSSNSVIIERTCFENSMVSSTPWRNSQRRLNWLIFWQKKEGRVRLCSVAGSTGSLAVLVVKGVSTSPLGFFWFLASKCYFFLMVVGLCGFIHWHTSNAAVFSFYS